MKTKIQLLSIVMVFFFVATHAQIKYPTTTKKTYTNTNLKNTNYTNYNNKIKSNTKLFSVNYSPLVISSRNLPREAYAKLESVKSKGISSFSFAPNGGWVIVTKNGEIYNYKIPSSLSSKINSLKQHNRKIKQIVFHPKKNNSWVIVTENSVYANRISKELNATLQAFIRKGKKIQSVSFGSIESKTWLVVNTDGSFYANNIPDICYLYLKHIYNLNMSSVKVSNVVFIPTNGWVILLTDGNFLYKNVSVQIPQQLSSNVNKDYRTNIIALTSNGKNWSVIANSKIPSKSKRIANYSLIHKRGVSIRESSTIKKNSYTSGDGIKDIRKWALKITLEYFYCDESDDSDNKDDYIFNQWVVYKDGQNKSIKKIDGKMKFNNSNQIDTKKKTKDGRYIVGNNIIIKSDDKHQFSVKEGQNNRKKIDNNIVFEISEELLLDDDSKFIIHSSLVERSDSKGGIITLPSAPGYGTPMAETSKEIKVDIENVIQDLVKLKTIQSGKWKYYGEMRLKKYNTNSVDIYGYINYSDADRNRKAKAMMRFKLIE